MPITMVKKRLLNGEPCDKCVQTEQMLRDRGQWDRIDSVVWAIEGDPESVGMELAAAHGIERAPFFIVTDDTGDEGDRNTLTFVSALRMLKHLKRTSETRTAPAMKATHRFDFTAAASALPAMTPAERVAWALKQFGESLTIAFSGAEDVVLIEMAVQSGLPFSVFCLDTGRLHVETYAFLERVRTHYKITVNIVSPERTVLEPFVREKGLFSFFEDGHKECCSIRKIQPLHRALNGKAAWITGQRRDQSPATRDSVPLVEEDGGHPNPAGDPMAKFNPLSDWTSAQVWTWIRDHNVPYNPLHERGFFSIGCAPCTRPVKPGQHEREGRWWWEDATKKECGLHLGPGPKAG